MLVDDRLATEKADILTVLRQPFFSGQQRQEVVMKLTGPNHPNWHGGRTITQHGYILIRVGKDHPLSDIRGYAYEHRVIAEKMLGRKLRSSEIVHHINDDRQDNRPENLQVCTGIAGHKVKHRTKKGLRLPGEPNPIISCKCGCGKTFRKYDNSNRPRQWAIGGHWRRWAGKPYEARRKLNATT